LNVFFAGASPVAIFASVGVEREVDTLLGGEAAFGFPQQDVLVVVLVSVALLVTLAMARQWNWPSEVAFLIAVAGGLISTPAAMIAIVLGCLFSTIVLGAIASWLGVKSELTPEQKARVDKLVGRAAKNLGVKDRK
jgi:hypothetical protein